MTVDVLGPTGFGDDVVALMALVRPGPMELAPVYIARKHGREPIAYMHPAMESILRETFGVPLYQEQVMQIARDLADSPWWTPTSCARRWARSCRRRWPSSGRASSMAASRTA